MTRFFLFTLFFIFSGQSFADCTLSIEVRDTIGPATFDYMERAQQKAVEKNCKSILVRINTPGGSLQSTRKIVEMIMNSPIPYLCLIHPSGGHAGSAGAIIMQACHINGAMEATNIGAASPISGSGEDMPEDLRKKIFEDTRSFVEGLAEYRGRSVEFAKAIVDEAKALSAQDALNEGAIDVVVSDIEAFLQFSKGKPVRMESDQTVEIEVAPLELFEPGLRHDVLQIFSNPQWAYLLFMGSIGLLYFELTHPGTLLPGVIGAIGLVISLVNFHMLDVSWGGVALILLGMAFLFAELFIPSFGALGLGGLASFVIGSLFLFDEKSGYSIPKDLLFTTTGVLFTLMAGVTYLAVSAKSRGLRNREKEKFEGKSLVIEKLNENKKSGLGKYKGELWKFKSKVELNEGDRVRVTSVEGLTLNVEKEM